jgi:NitT/TauT family transport system substrate-binding protein
MAQSNTTPANAHKLKIESVRSNGPNVGYAEMQLECTACLPVQCVAATRKAEPACSSPPAAPTHAYCPTSRFQEPTREASGDKSRGFVCSADFPGCHGQPATAGLTKVTLQADWYPQPEHGGFYTALAKGYYKDEGLDITIQAGSQYAIPDQQVAVGAAQFGMGSSDRTLESVADGHPLVAVAATMQTDPQGIMVRKDSPIHEFGDLHGHSIAVKPGSTWFQCLVKRNKLSDVKEIPATMSVANFVADPNYIQQAFATSEPFFARQAGIETRVLLTRDAGYNPYRVMFTARDFLQQHPDVVAKFVRASIKGWREYLKDPTTAYKTIAKLNPALSREWMKFSWQGCSMDISSRATMLPAPIRPDDRRPVEHYVSATCRLESDRQALRPCQRLYAAIHGLEVAFRTVSGWG